MKTDLQKIKDFILDVQTAAENNECLPLNIADVLKEIERLQALTLGAVGCSCADKETANFEAWLKQHRFKQIENTYVYKKGRMSIDKKQLWKVYKMINIVA